MLDHDIFNYQPPLDDPSSLYMPTKYTEDNVPDWLHVRVSHLHEGNCSRNQLKALGKTNAKYVTLCELYDGEDRVAEGVAACSKVDNPRRSIGRAIAIGRALKNYYTE